jgi:hypothetical protein
MSMESHIGDVMEDRAVFETNKKEICRRVQSMDDLTFFIDTPYRMRVSAGYDRLYKLGE